jgi:hypothetical protein
VVANLKKRGSAKPGTVPALKNSIFTSFPKLSQDQIDVLVPRVEKWRRNLCQRIEGHVCVGDKVAELTVIGNESESKFSDCWELQEVLI